MKHVKLIIPVLLLIAFIHRVQGQDYPFRNPSLSFEERVDDLLIQMTLEEKVSQMMHRSVAIPRLSIPAYNWWNECLHGVGRSGDKVTVFPQAIGLASTFDPDALKKMAEITATEARAIYNDAQKSDKAGAQYKGLTFWTPNINIFRDPRWGRGQETYGEDPYLTSVMGCAMVEGLQGNDARYYKTSACAKHYAVHSGPEAGRHEFDSRVDNYELWDTYLPAFKALVKKAHVSSVMCAYNRYNGQPCCGNDELMMNILRNKWNFSGYVTSDCGAIDDFYKYHKTHANAVIASADAVLHGTDLDCGEGTYQALNEAVKKGLIREKDIDESVKRLFMTRFRLGMFDPESLIPYSTISYDTLACKAHADHALEMACKSMVLLKNESSILPLKNRKKILVMGPNADNPEVQLGNYNGYPSVIITPLDALKTIPGIELTYLKATDYTITDPQTIGLVKENIAKSDLILFIGGISPRLEGEEGDAGKEKLNGFHGGDRTSIILPEVQTHVMKQVKESGKPLVFICMSGSAIAFEWESKNADAILQTWYGGQSAGTAIANILIGHYNPSGRLPVTFYKSEKDLPNFHDYHMSGRTYRYFNKTPLYPFGFGLSYSTFEYSQPVVQSITRTDSPVLIKVEVRNTSQYDGDEVVQLYISHERQMIRKPICSLQGFKRIHLKAKERKTIEFTLEPEQLSLVNEQGIRSVAPGAIKVHIGGSQPEKEGWDNTERCIRLELQGSSNILDN